MRGVVERERPDLLAAAVEAVGEDPFARVADGTRFAQPAIFCASLVGWEHAAGDEPAVVAGHSLGEFAALVAAGSLTAADGLRLVTLRGRLMDEAGSASDGGMLAVLSRHSLDPAFEAAERHGVTVANDNAPGQVVLSGDRGALDAVEQDLGDARVKVVRLPVSGAFHSPAMQPAVEAFRQALEETDFAEPDLPVVSCVTAAPLDRVRERLAAGLTHPVRWRETLLRLHSDGARVFVETGPGKVLTGLVKRTLKDVEARAACPMEGVEGVHA
jgi:malonyl CoA-acyl carrier protein transacylase